MRRACPAREMSWASITADLLSCEENGASCLGRGRGRVKVRVRVGVRVRVRVRVRDGVRVRELRACRGRGLGEWMEEGRHLIDAW